VGYKRTAIGQSFETRRQTRMAEQTGASDREAEIIAAYRRGDKVTQIEHDFGVGRSTLYHVLKRSGVKPSRTRDQLDAGSRDSTLAGLHELIRHQDRLIAEKDAEIARLKAAMNGSAKKRTTSRRA